MANDIDIIVGVKDLATSVLDRLAARVNAIGDNSKLAFAGAAERLNDQLAKSSSNLGGNSNGNNDRLAKAIEAAAAGLSTKLDAALAKVNSSVDSLNAKVQNTITKVTDFVSKAAAIATVGSAFYTIGKDIKAFITGTEKAQLSIMKLVAVGGATASLTTAIHSATSATTGLVGKVHALGRAALSAFVLREALKKTETGAMTLSAKLARVAGFALAADIATRATVRFGLSLIGIKKKADDSTNALIKTANAGNTLSTTASKITAAPFVAVKTGASAAAAATANLASKFEELPKGAESVNTIVSGFGRFAASIGGIPGLLLSIPAGIAGIALAAVTSASKTERQLTLLTNKLSIIEAAKLNISIDEIDTAPLRKLAEETEKIAKQLQTATNTQSSKLISLAISSLPKGLDSAQIGEALKSAVGLAEVYGTSIEDGMYRTRQAIEGNFESFEKLIPAIATMATNEEKLAAVSMMASNGLKVASKESLTFWGTIEKVKNGLGNTIESLGKMKSLSDVVATVLRDVVTPAVDQLDKYLKGFGFNGSKVLEQATAIGAGIIAAIETISNNWNTLIDRMTISAELFWVQLRSQAENFVRTTLPWIADNIVGIFQHAWAAVGQDAKSQFDIMVTEAMEAMGAVPEGTADFQRAELARKPKYKPEALPELAAREKGGKELDLENQLSKLDSKLKDSFKINFDKAFTSLDGVLEDQKNALTANLTSKAPAVDPAAIDEKTKKTTDNLQALQSRFLARGTSNDPQREMAMTMRRSEELQKRQVALLERQLQDAKNNQTKSISNIEKWEVEFVRA